MWPVRGYTLLRGRMIVNKWSIAKIKDYLFALDEEEQERVIGVLSQDERKGVQALCTSWYKEKEKRCNEKERLKKLWYYEDQAMAEGSHYIAGTDEVGRGPLAGPVVAAAVILPRDVELYGINDSKKLSEAKREELCKEIRSVALDCAIIAVSAKEIDHYNILKAAELAMAQAVSKLKKVDHVLVDGLNKPPIDIRQSNIISGDSKSVSIAAASILAKVWRDHYMIKLDERYPGYGFAAHKGYGTREHYEGLRNLGPSPEHRQSFTLFKP